MAKPTEFCIFCGVTLTRKNVSREHVIAAWLGQFIAKDKANYHYLKATTHRDRSDVDFRIRGGDPQSRTVRCVCRSCNSGWMSELQNRVKPTVSRLVRGECFRLDESSKNELAAWVATAVMVSEYDDPETVAISEVDRAWLYASHRAPPDWRIWFGDYSRDTWTPGWIRHHLLVVDDDAGQLVSPASSSNTQIVTYVLGRLLIHVMSSAVTGIVTGWTWGDRQASCLRQIWPSTPFSITWPPPTLNDNDADYIAGEFFSSAHRLRR